MLDNLLFQLRLLLVAVNLAAGFVDTNTAFYVKSTNNFGCSLGKLYKNNLTF